MASIPEERMLIYEPAFITVGIDYFGSFLVKRGRSECQTVNRFDHNQQRLSRESNKVINSFTESKI